jgi:predicted ATPase
MVGREEEVERILRQLESVVSGTARQNVLFITGEAGLGKSTLLGSIDDACSRLDAPPTVAIVQCSTPLAGRDLGEVEALGPWIEIMSRLATLRNERQKETRKLVADLAIAWVKFIPIVGDLVESVADTATILKEHRQGKDPAGATAQAANQEQLFQQYINFLSRLSEETPLLLMIDDFHWADTSSTNLLFAAARQLQGKPVLFIVAYRADDAASSRNGEGHPILHIRNELERYDLAAEVPLPRMEAGDLDTLLRRRYPNYQNNDGFEEWIARVGGGNPLFITRFLDTLEEDGHIDRATGVIGEGYQGVQVPASAQAVVQERIRRLDEDTRELLRYASVEGDTFTLLILSRITELAQLKLLQRLRLTEEKGDIIHALGRQQIYATETACYRFAHALIHKALYDALTLDEQLLLHEAVFDVLNEQWEQARESGINVAQMAARMAIHAEALGRYTVAADALLEGAKASWREYAEEEALRQIEQALSLADAAEASGAANPGDLTRIRGVALQQRGTVHRSRSRLAEALEDLRKSGMLLAEASQTKQLAWTYNWESDVLYLLGRYDEAMRRAAESLELAQSIGDLTNEAYACNNSGSIHWIQGDYAAALTDFNRAVECLESLGDLRGKANTLNNIGLVYERLLDNGKAMEFHTRSLELKRQIGDGPSEAASLHNIGTVLYAQGKHREAIEHFGQSLEIKRRVGDRIGEGTSMYNTGCVYLELQEFDTARTYLQGSQDIFTLCGHPEGIAWSTYSLGSLSRVTGKFVEARKLLERALELAGSVGLKVIEDEASKELGLLEEGERG